MKTCALVGSSDFDPRRFDPEGFDCIIGVDGGCDHLRAAGIEPAVVVGDFDSASTIPDADEVVKLIPEKDDTDMEAAANLAIERGFDAVELYGALGGRLDHSLGNLSVLLMLARAGVSAIAVDGDVCCVMLDGDGYDAIEIPAAAQGIVSVLPVGGDATGVSISGLKYELADGVLRADRTLGISNECVGKNAEVAVGSGNIVVCLPVDVLRPLKDDSTD